MHLRMAIGAKCVKGKLEGVVVLSSSADYGAGYEVGHRDGVSQGISQRGGELHANLLKWAKTYEAAAARSSKSEVVIETRRVAAVYREIADRVRLGEL